MSALLNPDTCARCGLPLLLGDKVVPVWVITHKGRVHTEADPTRQMAHVVCPTKEEQ